MTPSVSPGRRSTRIENGRYLPSLPLAFAIARSFDSLIEDIFTPQEDGT